MAGAPPANRHLPKRSRAAQAQRVQREAPLQRKGKLPERFLRRDYRALKAVFIQPWKRAGVVGVRMGQEHGVQRPNLLRRQAGIRVVRRVCHFPAVHQKAKRTSLHIETAAAVLAHAAGDDQLHVRLPSAFQRSD